MPESKKQLPVDDLICKQQQRKLYWKGGQIEKYFWANASSSVFMLPYGHGASDTSSVYVKRLTKIIYETLTLII